jgi:hypothetical protein
MMPRAGKGMGHDTVEGHQGETNLKTRPDEEDIADQAHGNNQLQGDDQKKTRNQRRDYPDSE